MFRWWTRPREVGEATRLLEAVFRVGVAGCFIGHGAFGILGKEAWLPYFAVVGLPEAWAWSLMPIVGTVDILVGLLALVSPRPAVLAYAAGWGFFTAVLRPLAGESVFEALERAGNYGIPLAFLVASGFRAHTATLRDWLAPVGLATLPPATRKYVSWVLRATVALLLVGHGGLAIGGKPLLIGHVSLLGMDAELLAALGWSEIVLGLAVAVRPAPGLLLLALGWKVSTEALYPLSGAPFWEFVERAGSYAAPAALLALHRPGLPATAGVRRLKREGAVASVAAIAALTLATPALAAGHGLHGVPLGASPSVAVVAPTPRSEIFALLREGSLVLACRHAITDRGRGDSRRVDYDDPSTQRVLSAAGRRQARRLGRVLADLGVPIGEVLTSPYARTRDSAQLAFDRSERSDALVYGNRPEQLRERRRLLAETPAGGNRVLMTHQGVLYGMLQVERGSIREGDCVVVEPRGAEGHEVLGRFGPEDFAGLAEAAGSRRRHSSRTTLPSRST